VNEQADLESKARQGQAGAYRQAGEARAHAAVGIAIENGDHSGQRTVEYRAAAELAEAAAQVYSWQRARYEQAGNFPAALPQARAASWSRREALDHRRAEVERRTAQAMQYREAGRTRDATIVDGYEAEARVSYEQALKRDRDANAHFGRIRAKMRGRQGAGD
jgi:hypothetical protein